MNASRTVPIGLLSLCLAASAAQAQSRPSGTKAAAPRQIPAIEVEKLVAPIALYPDVLVAQILPAATFPTDVVMAARWLRTKPDMEKLLDQKWDPSVLSLCNYPDIIYKMDADLEWTNALGAAFLDHQQELMNAIQALRAKAHAAGVLQSNEQQTIVQEKANILIVPASPQTVYVPQYDPQVIYVEDDDDDEVSVGTAVTASAISFAAGMALGAWLDMDCDWGGCCVNYCQPGYWGGYARLYGPTAVAWGNSWAAAVGPRRAAYVGPHGAAYAGPRGAAARRNGHGAAWARPTPYGRPSYTGRYASYGQYSNYRRGGGAGNTYNLNRSNVNVDRGDRSYYQGGQRTNYQGGNRANYGGASGQQRQYSGEQKQYSGQRPQAQNRSSGYSQRSSRAFGSSGYGSQVNRSSSRGYSSRGYSGRSYSGGGRSMRGGGGRRR